MGFFAWLTQQSDFLQNLGIIGGLVFTAHSLRRENEARKIGNLIAITQNHRSIWKEMFDRPELSRVKDERADLISNPLTNEERVFVTSLIIHLSVVHQAAKAKMFFRLEGIRKDIRGFFVRPVPKSVWESVKPYQDDDFVQFVEKALAQD